MPCSGCSVLHGIPVSKKKQAVEVVTKRFLTQQVKNQDSYRAMLGMERCLYTYYSTHGVDIRGDGVDIMWS